MNWAKYFYYEEGKLYWKQSIGTAKLGKEAGSLSKKGYLQVKVNKKLYFLHRVVYSMLVNEIPKGYQIDHADGNKLNNRIENLRLATHQQNRVNQDCQKNNKLRVKGVYYDKTTNKYRARITFNKIRKNLGLFSTIEEASEAYNQAAKELHKEFYYVK